MDRGHCLAAARYIEMNPVRAKLAAEPTAYPWSSARAHVTGVPDALVGESSLTQEVGDWKMFLDEEPSAATVEALRRHERTGRPLGSEGFVEKLEGLIGRRLRPKKAGRPRKERN